MEKKTGNYFGLETETAIIEFQAETDRDKREKIFNGLIKQSFKKLIENIIFVYKFHFLDDIETLKNDCLAHLFGVLYKFDESRNKKAFSYFNVITKNWFIQQVKLNKKRAKFDVKLDRETLTRLENTDPNFAVSPYENELINNEFFILLKENIHEWKKKFYKESETKVIDAIILLLENPDYITLYNKKGIYIFLRELTGLSTKQIAANLMKIKKKYVSFKKRYGDGEI